MIKAELSPNGRKIDVHFQKYNPADVRRIKTVPDAAWRNKDGCWRVNADLATGRELRRLYGITLQLGPRLAALARVWRDEERNLHAMTSASDAKLLRVEKEFSDYLRPYQRAGAAFLATGNRLNGDDMGLGKTAETLAALIETGSNAATLVVAPKSSVEAVWPPEIFRWLPDAEVVTIHGDNRVRNQPALLPGTWVVMTPHLFRQLEWLLDVQWGTFIVDEFHLAGLTNANTQHDKGSLFFQKAMGIAADRRYLISGTPIGGQPLRLWGALYFLDPHAFSSKWRWAQQWLECKDGAFGREIGGILPEKEDEFYKYHARWILRRTKAEVLPQLPPKQYVPVICTMLPRQRKQYRQFMKEAELIIDDVHLTATNKLSELARLKAFASAECWAQKLRDGKIKLHPDFEKGGKAQPLLERLLEGGVNQGVRQAIVGTQFSEVADSIFEFLNMRDFSVGKITGAVKAGERANIVRGFQRGDLQVVVLTLQAGGVSITLDAADHVHVIDEHFNPDVQTQFEDRAHRMSRIHQVTVYQYRTRGTLEEEINQQVLEKQFTNEQILDNIRIALKGAA